MVQTEMDQHIFRGGHEIMVCSFGDGNFKNLRTSGINRSTTMENPFGENNYCFVYDFFKIIVILIKI